MPTPAVTIVIPVYNDSATLAACLRGVLAHTTYPDWDILVVDDGSTDGSRQVLQEFKTVRYLKKSRGGVASALNAGFAAAPGRDIVRLHADVVIETAGWLEQLVTAAYAQPKAGVVGVRLVYPDGRVQSEGRSLVSGLGFHQQHRQLKAFQPDGAPGKVREVDGVAGALAYYRREALDRVGGLDENYGPAWLEDDDFCISVRRANYKVYVHAGIRAVHFARSQPPTFQFYLPGGESELKQITADLKHAAERIQGEYWEAKWGWDPYCPDLGEIRRLYGETEICWQIGEPLRFRPSSDTPTVDCCLVTWNTLPLLRRCLESLATTDYPADRLNVYVADNSSTDGTLEYLEQLQPTYPFQLHVLRLPVNTGAPVGLNFAIVQGQGELVARLDDDIVLPSNWVKVLVGDLLKRPYAGCIGPKIINDDDRQAIQCGPYRHYPGIYGHDDEADTGQADYLSRATHVRGCCNLYRRDVFARCGLFDIRFSPSQCDDPDHHLALLHAGYEVLYDGRVRVIHKLNNGLARSLPAITNQQGNQGKMIGKWGRDAFEVLECALDLSREGRYLPDDADTSAWLALAPDPALYPKKRADFAMSRRGLVVRIYAEVSGIVQPGSALEKICDEYLAFAQIRHRDGAPRHALDVLLVAANFAPLRPDVFKALARTYIFIGQCTLGRTMAKRGLYLQPTDAELSVLASTPDSGSAPSVAQANMTVQINSIGEHSVQVGSQAHRAACGPATLRVLMVNTFSPRAPGGDQNQLKKTRQYLQDLGVHVDICCTPRPDPRGYDLVHLWNTWFPHETLTQAKAIRAWVPDMPIALSPIYWNLAEKTWSDHAVPLIFSNSTNINQIDQNLALLANDQINVNGITRGNAREGPWRLFVTYQKRLFGLVDHLLPQSHAELANLKKTLGVEMNHTVIYNAAEAAVFDQASPDWFIKQYGVKDFVITVGLVEPRKNQLMLLHALRESGIPIVVVGRHYDRRYYQLCRKFAPKGTIFIDHMPHEQLASALKAARVFTLPSWVECASLANIEAALCGCALAVSDRTSEKEYFGEGAYYCDPSNISSIRTGVLNAFNNHMADAPKRTALADKFRNRYTWKLAAEQTLLGYHAAIASRRQRVTA